MNDSGFILISREMLDHPVFAKEPYCEPLAWVWLIREASWKDRTVRVGRAVIELRRGSCAVSTRFLADRWMWSESRVRRYLGRLSKHGLIDIKTDAQATQVTICNYDRYQLSAQVSDAEATHDRRTTDANKKELNTLNEGNKGKEEPAGSPKSRGSRLPDNWKMPDEWRAEASNRGMADGRISIEAEKFFNHFTSAPGQRGVKTDWKKTWINWVLGVVTPKSGKASPDDATGSKSFLFGRM